MDFRARCFSPKRSILANVAFCTAATENGGLPTLKLQWTTDDPVWVAQWPLPQAKLEPLQTLVKEQLELGHIRPSTSDWNTPIFVIKQKSGKWRLLHDLRAVNADALMKACYVLNWKNPVGPDPGAIPMQTHLGGNPHDFLQHQVQVLVWNPATAQWEGPHVLLTWGKGYACVVIGQQTRWVPAKWVKPWIPAGNENKGGGDSGSSHSAQD